MNLNLIGFAAAVNEARNRNLPESNANRIGVIGALSGNTMMGWVIGRSMAEREAAELAASQPPRDTGTPPGGGTPADEIPRKVEAAVALATAAGEAAEGAKAEVAALKSEMARGFEEIKRRLDHLAGSAGNPPPPNPKQGGTT